MRCDLVVISHTTDHLHIGDLTAEGVSGQNGVTGKTGPDFDAGPGAYVVVSTNDGAVGTATVTAEADPDEVWTRNIWTRNSGDAVSRRSVDGHDRTVDWKRPGQGIPKCGCPAGPLYVVSEGGPHEAFRHDG